jgi:hypothetical protein
MGSLIVVVLETQAFWLVSTLGTASGIVVLGTRRVLVMPLMLDG